MFGRQMASVGDVMSRGLVQVDPTTTVAEAATVMAQRRVGSVLVMDGQRLAGIFTERDMVRAISQSADAPTDEIAHYMTRHPATIEAAAETDEALDRMVEGGYRHLPVLEGEAVIGMVSMRDIAALEAGS